MLLGIFNMKYIFFMQFALNAVQRQMGFLIPHKFLRYKTSLPVFAQG